MYTTHSFQRTSQPIAPPAAPDQEPTGAYSLGKWKRGRNFAVYSPGGDLICICVYKKGAEEVIRRLEERQAENDEEFESAMRLTGSGAV